MTADSVYLRPAQAAARFGVSKSTLYRWARSRLIGRACIGGVVHYDSREIADLILRHTTQRAVVPITATASPCMDWRELPLWKGRQR